MCDNSQPRRERDCDSLHNPTSEVANVPAPITGTVRFNVSATPYKAADDRWMVQTVETGLVTYGRTEEEAITLNAKANVLLVARWKTHGRRVLDRFMKKHGIVDYTIDDEEGVSVPGARYTPVQPEMKLAA